MPKQIKALLVGVTQYENQPPQGGGNVVLTLPSAALDVGAMLALFNSLRQPGVVDVEIDCLLLGRDIRKQGILDAIGRLCQDVRPDEAQDIQLVFYFSGHGLLVPAADGGTGRDEALCPADVNWKTGDNCIRFQEFLDIINHALVDGAGIEVILESCSAANFVPEKHRKPKGNRFQITAEASLSSQEMVKQSLSSVTHIQRFGCAFGGAGGPAGAGAVWNASRAQMPSYSAPVPVGTNNPPQGLFTHFFCKHFASSKTRLELLDAIYKDLTDYWIQRNGIFGKPGCCDDDLMRLSQIPTLYTVDVQVDPGAVQVNCQEAQDSMPVTQTIFAKSSGGMPVPVGGGTPFSGGGARLTGKATCGSEINPEWVMTALQKVVDSSRVSTNPKIPVAPHFPDPARAVIAPSVVPRPRGGFDPAIRGPR